MCSFFSVAQNTPQTQNSADVPSLVEGVWQRDDKIIFFDVRSKNEPEGSMIFLSENSLFSSILKTYYGWYYDRAAEPIGYSENTKRFRCVPTPEQAERISVTVDPIPGEWQYAWSEEIEIPSEDGESSTKIRRIKNSQTSGAYEIVLSYTNREVTRIPVAVIDGKMYLDFLVKPPLVRADTDDGNADSEDNANTDESENYLPLDKPYGYWQGVSQKRGILVAPLKDAENVYSYYFSDNSVYTLRYWKTNTDFVSRSASFTDVDHEFRVPKHIITANTIYTCATGRRTLIRNIDKSLSLEKEMTLDSTGTICVFGKPYLIKSEEATNENELMEIVASANSRRKPDPPPLFPPSEAKWHWEDIHRLEAGNAIIEEVRKRQRQFAGQPLN